MSWHSLPQKNKLLTRYLLIVLAFVLLALGVFMFFKFRIKMIEKKMNQGFPVSNKINLECPAYLGMKSLTANA